MTIENYKKLIETLCEQATTFLNHDGVLTHRIDFQYRELQPNENELGMYKAKAQIFYNETPLFKDEYVGDDIKICKAFVLKRLLANIFTHGISNAINVKKQFQP